MEQKRKYERFDPAIQINGYFELNKEVTGEFRNREEFLIKNISSKGFNLISNYPPAIGDPTRFLSITDGKSTNLRSISSIPTFSVFKTNRKVSLKPALCIPPAAKLSLKTISRKT